MATVDDVLGPPPAEPAPSGTVDSEGLHVTIRPPAAKSPDAKPSVDDILGPPLSKPPSSKPSVDDILGPSPDYLTPKVDEVLDTPPARPKAGVVPSVERVLGAAGDAVAHLFTGDYGISRESLGSLVNQTPEQEDQPFGLVRSFNDVLIRGGSSAVDVVGRAFQAPIVAGVAATVQAAKEAGMDDTQASMLERDLLGLSIAFGVVTGTHTDMAGALPKFRQKARERIVDAADDLPPEAQAAGRYDMAQALDAGMDAGRREAGEPPPVPPKPPTAGGVPPNREPLTEPRITQPLSKHVVDAAEQLLTEGGVQRSEGRLLSDQIMELLQTRRLSTERIGQILEAHDLTPDDFAEIWRVNIRKAAQDMQTLSAVEQRLKALRGEPGAEADLGVLRETQGIGADERGLNWYKRVDNIRRGLLVTQLATAMRNFVTQTARLGVDTLQQGMDAGLRRVFSSPGVRQAHPIDAFGALANMFVRPRLTKERVGSILGAFPAEQDRLFGNWMGEFQKGAFGKAETAVTLLNTANRFQEFVIRRAVFASRLDTALRAEGKSLEDIVARNAIGEVSRDTIKAAVNDSLALTWGRGFSPFAKGAEGLAGKIIGVVNDLPGATMVMPFPRFFFNALKFQYDFSPLGYLKLLSPSQRAAIAGGDMSAITQATIGTGMLLAAHQFRNSSYAGERWYEARLPDGRTLDLRPFNPFASYLFLADLAKRVHDGTLDQLSSKDIASGVLSTQMRAGTGLYILDSVLDGIAGLDVGEKGKRAIAELAGNYLSGFTVPLNMVRDFISQFDESQRIIRTGREGPTTAGGFVSLGPVERNLPFVNKSLPPVYSPLRQGPLVRESPAARQLTGFGIQSVKNPVEAEVDRLGLERKEYFPSTGDPTADRLLETEMGRRVAHEVPQLVEHPAYKKLAPAVQAFVLLEALKGVRDEAKGAVAEREPALAARLRLEGMPGRKRKALDALSGGQITQAIELLRGAEQTLAK